jgi:hypothetical protein
MGPAKSARPVSHPWMQNTIRRQSGMGGTSFFCTPLLRNTQAKKWNEPSPSRSGLPGIRVRQGQPVIIKKSLTPLAFPFKLTYSKKVLISFQIHTARGFHPKRRGEGESLKT